MHKILINFYFFEFFLATTTPRPSPTSKYLKLIQIIGQAEKRIILWQIESALFNMLGIWSKYENEDSENDAKKGSLG